MKHIPVVCAAMGAVLVCAGGNVANAQSEIARRAIEPWAGTADTAHAASRSGATIPLSTYSIVPTKGNGKKALTGTIVGGNPFSSPPTGSVINAVIVPMTFNIGGTVFDSTAPNSCDAGYSVVNRFNLSPLVQPVPNLTFNGVDVGTVQYVDGFMRAEFWNAIGGNPAYSNSINWSTAASVTITTGSDGITYGTGCGLVGIVSQTLLNSQIAGTLQTLTQSGVISPTNFVLFLTADVVGSSANPPTPPGTSTCCNYGYHTATGNPPQFYAFADYAQGEMNNIAIVSHEIAEFMNDPLITNETPAWGEIGNISGCSKLLEVGDPLGWHASLDADHDERLHLSSGRTRVLQLVLQLAKHRLAGSRRDLLLERKLSGAIESMPARWDVLNESLSAPENAALRPPYFFFMRLHAVNAPETSIASRSSWILTMLPSVSTTKVVRFAIPAFSFNTP